jgi:hypothetical protein
MEKRLFKVTVIYTLFTIIEGEAAPVNKKSMYIYRAERPLDILKKITQGHVLGWKKQDGCFMHPQRYNWAQECDNSGLGEENFWRLEISPVESNIIDA